MYKFCIPLSIAFILFTSCSRKINTSKVLADLKEISDDKYEGRKTNTKGAELAANFITERLNSLEVLSYQLNYSHPFKINLKGKELTGNNIIGYVQGKTDDVIVISAHYDHVGIINNKIFNGADDNASGTCALLSYAEYFKKNQPKHTIVFAFFDAEEMGLLGSKNFVENPPVKIDHIKLNINLDMIGQNDKGELYASGTYHHPELKKYIVTKNANPKIIFGHDDPKLGRDDWTNQSDHYSFHQAKIPYIYFGVEDHKDYHKETDEFQNINQEFYLNGVLSILDIIKNFDTDFSTNTLLKNNKRM